MEKLLMCRVCLAQNVRMYVVVNTNLHVLYEKLSDNPFVTEDSRPMLVCFFCCTKLKQCYQFQRKCLEAEELFAQMMNEGSEPNPLINQDNPKFYNGFIQSPVMHIDIVGECQTECVAIKEELPAVCERLDDIIVPKEEHQSDELELKRQENRFSVVDDKPTIHHSESDDDTLPEFKIEVEEHEVSMKKPKLEDVIPEEQKRNEQSDTNVIRTTENCMFNTVTKFKKPLTVTKLEINHFSLNTNCRNEVDIKFEKSKNIIGRDVKRHRILHVKEKSFKCDVCKRCFSWKSQLTTHSRIHTGEKPFKCKVCDRSFRQKCHLTSHIQTHAGEKPFKCNVCQTCFSKKGSLSRHIRTHTGEKPFKCDICQRCLSDKNSLEKHIRIHTGEKPLTCDYCQRCFIGKSHLKFHIRTHTGEKPFKCDICQSSFYQKGALTKHNRMHTGEKPFKCHVCQRGFSEKANLTSHIRTHTGEKPYQCDICHRSFNKKSNLATHIRKHAYKCHICRRGFEQKNDLTDHVRTHTPKILNFML